MTSSSGQHRSYAYLNDRETQRYDCTVHNVEAVSYFSLNSMRLIVYMVVKHCCTATANLTDFSESLVSGTYLLTLFTHTLRHYVCKESHFISLIMMSDMHWSCWGQGEVKVCGCSLKCGGDLGKDAYRRVRELR